MKIKTFEHGKLTSRLLQPLGSVLNSGSGQSWRDILLLNLLILYRGINLKDVNWQVARFMASIHYFASRWKSFATFISFVVSMLTKFEPLEFGVCWKSEWTCVLRLGCLSSPGLRWLGMNFPPTNMLDAFKDNIWEGMFYITLF